MTVRDHLGRSLAVGGALAVLGIGGITMTERALAVAPVAPANAADRVLSVASAGIENNQTIPDAVGPTTPGPAITSTITVGEHGIIRDADLQTFLHHASSGDLDITVTSPKGTVVTLVKTRRDAMGNAVVGPAGPRPDSYMGTVWDDQAATLAMTAPYATGAQASLVPEGALGAFVGEDAFGTWTLTIQDRVPDGLNPILPENRQLNSWKLNLTTDSAAPADLTSTRYDSPNPPVAIATSAVNQPPATTTSTFTVSGAKSYLWNVNLRTSLVHNNPIDLEVTLSHAGKSALISLANSGPFDFMDGVTWSDQPATPGTAQVPITQAALNGNPKRVTPEGAMAVFAGTNPNGDWTLEVKNSDKFTGSLNAWALDITSTDGYPAPVVTPPAPTPPVGGGSTGTPLPPPSKPRLGVTAFSLLRAKDAVKFKLGWVRGTGRVTWNVQLSTKLGKRTVVRRVKGSLAAGSKTITRTVRIPRSWKGHRVTARLVIKNGTTTIARTRTLRV